MSTHSVTDTDKTEGTDTTAGPQPFSLPDKIIATSGFLLPLMGVASPVNSVTILAIAMAVAVPLYRRHRKHQHIPFLWYALLAFLGWGGITIFWALDTGEAVSVWLRLLAIAAAAYILFQMVVHYDHGSRAIGRVMRWLVLGHVIALALLTLDIVLQPGPLGWLNNTFSKTPFHFEKLNRGATVIALTLWPCLLGIRQLVPGHRKHMLLAAAMIAATAAVLSQLNSLAAIVSLVVGLGVFTYAYWIRVAVRIALKIGLVTMLALMPLVALFWMQPARWIAMFPDMPASMQHRLYIYEFVAHKALEKPWLGWGLKSSKFLPGGWQQVHEGMALLPLHPHNAVLQVWLEMGVVGLVLLAICLLAMLYSIGQAGYHFPRPVRAVYYSVFFAYMATSLTAYGFWQNWWLAAAVIAAAVTRYVAGALSFQEEAVPPPAAPADNTPPAPPPPPAAPDR